MFNICVNFLLANCRKKARQPTLLGQDEHCKDTTTEIQPHCKDLFPDGVKDMTALDPNVPAAVKIR